jgi:hypothetical protein
MAESRAPDGFRAAAVRRSRRPRHRCVRRALTWRYSVGLALVLACAVHQAAEVGSFVAFPD